MVEHVLGEMNCDGLVYRCNDRNVYRKSTDLPAPLM